MIERRKIWTARVLTLLIILAFVPSGIMKVVHHPMAVEGFQRMGIPESAILILGIVELSCLIFFLVPRTAVLGTLLLTGYLGGATLANIINRSDFIHALAIGLLVWAAAWLRVPELRTLVPVRRLNQARAEGGDRLQFPRMTNDDASSRPHTAPTR